MVDQIFGEFIEVDPDKEDFLLLSFSPHSLSLQQRWRNSGLSADFMADYLSTFFPGEDEAALDRRDDIRGTVSYIVNELLENAMKFSYTPAKKRIRIGMHLDENEIHFYVTNNIDPKTVKTFQATIQELLTEDPDELMMRQLTRHAESEEELTGSGMGFLTIINHYGAELAWKFTHSPDQPDQIAVTTMVHLTI